MGVLLENTNTQRKDLREVRRNARLKERERDFSRCFLFSYHLPASDSSLFLSSLPFTTRYHSLSLSLSRQSGLFAFSWLILNDLGGFDCSDEDETCSPCSDTSMLPEKLCFLRRFLVLRTHLI